MNEIMNEIVFDESIGLIEELEPYVTKNDGSFDSLRHPLIYHIPYTGVLNDLINKQFLFKKEATEKALKEKNWATYIFLHEKPYRFEAFDKIKSELSDKKYWKLLAEVYINSENCWQYKSMILNFFKSKRNYREFLMNAKERSFLKKLPDEIEIYRGCQKHNKNGFSWTLSKEIAEWFANRFKKDDNKVLTKKINKSRIIAVFLDRNEKEIIYI